MASTSASSVTPSQDQLLALAFAGQDTLMPAAEDNQVSLPHKFLALAPTTSDSYPTSPKARPDSTATATVSSAGAQAAIVSAEVAGTPALPDNLLKSRRSSSTGSEGSTGQKGRFLKLGPVHFGEDKDGKGDWSEDVIWG
ncbi:uncharacterized protein BP5553_08538 [Venustampulla echinocandica]|uniref:Uncharacterized protein n=1 Tax=Venustampulla echinocandica TaxID=2656787 RepID=A0A370TEI7_9HELO|nr:uncharacterized protein BP5553_08538 [Venustampulla echinocandica]RDL33099.1 hypothetical protein BP5553_08538 [Venustampulla echinocandica]